MYRGFVCYGRFGRGFGFFGGDRGCVGGGGRGDGELLGLFGGRTVLRLVFGLALVFGGCWLVWAAGWSCGWLSRGTKAAAGGGHSGGVAGAGGGVAGAGGGVAGAGGAADAGAAAGAGAAPMRGISWVAGASGRHSQALGLGDGTAGAGEGGPTGGRGVNAAGRRGTSAGRSVWAGMPLPQAVAATSAGWAVTG